METKHRYSVTPVGEIKHVDAYFQDRGVIVLDGESYSDAIVKDWTPVVGELCIFTDSDLHEYVIAEYGSKHDSLFTQNGMEFSYDFGSFSDVYPIEFINILLKNRGRIDADNI